MALPTAAQLSLPPYSPQEPEMPDRFTETPSKLKLRAANVSQFVRKVVGRPSRLIGNHPAVGKVTSVVTVVFTCLFGRVTRVFIAACLIWVYFCVQSAVPVCALALGGGSPSSHFAFYAKVGLIVFLGPLATGILTVRFWHVFMFAPPGGVLRRYVLDRVGRILVQTSGGLLLTATWVCAVLLAATGILHFSSLTFLLAIFFNSLVTLWFLMGHDRIVSAALLMFKQPSIAGLLSCAVCVALIAEPFVAAAVASASPGTLSIATFWKLQTGLGACLGLFSKVVNVLGRIRSRADEYERKVKERQQQQQRRVTRFASI